MDIASQAVLSLMSRRTHVDSGL